MKTGLSNLEGACKELHDKASGTPERKRVAVAAGFGYLDARFIANLYATHGFPLEESAAFARMHGLRIDGRGLEHELVMTGMAAAAATLMAKRALDAWAEEAAEVLAK